MHFLRFFLALSLLINTRLVSAQDINLETLTPAEDVYNDFSESRIYKVEGSFGYPNTDSDKDSVVDYEDNCPDTPLAEPVDECGCPIDFCAIDSDSDGVPDCHDKCRRTPLGVAVDKDGCPLPIIKKTRIRLNVNFEFAQANIQDEYVADLERLRALLVRFPKLVVTLEGHTDSKGSFEYNDALSSARARICRSYILTDSRIHPDRIRAVGFGERQPIASNKTDAGRAENRRTVAELDVEFGLPVDGNGRTEQVMDGEIPLNIIDPTTIPAAYIKPLPPPVPSSVTKDKEAQKAAPKRKTAAEVLEDLRRYQEQQEALMTPEQRESAAKMRKAIEDARKRAAPPATTP